jgi:hypothetical protein
VKNEGKLKTLFKTAKAKVTAKADEVKAIEKGIQGRKREAGRQKDRSRVIRCLIFPF